jgi:hypothetical protein
MKAGVIVEPPRRDWRGWRLFNQAQVDRLKAKTDRIIETGRYVVPAHSAPGDIAGKQVPDIIARMS